MFSYVSQAHINLIYILAVVSIYYTSRRSKTQIVVVVVLHIIIINTTKQEILINMEDPCHMCKDWLENGDGSQFVCDICHSEQEKEVIVVDDDATITFPDDADDTDDEKSDFEKVIPWREVPLMKWQRLIKTLNINTVHGAAMILTLQTRKGAIYQCWSTKTISTRITMKEKEKANRNLFIKSMGKKDCKYSKNFYYDFRCKIM